MARDLATTYDYYYRTCGPQASDLALKQFLLKDPVRAGHALDIGVGTGHNALILSQNGFSTYGIDISRVAIEMTQNLMRTHNQKGLFEVKDAASLDLSSRRFDLVLWLMVAHYMEREDVQKLSQKIVGSLADRGRVLFSVLSKKDPQHHKPNKKPLGRLIKTFMTPQEVESSFTGLKTLLLEDGSDSQKWMDKPTEENETAPIERVHTVFYLGRKFGGSVQDPHL